MKLRSKESGVVKRPTAALESSSSSTTAAASFASVLDIILSTQRGVKEVHLLENSSIKLLRLVCKATKQVVDCHVQSFSIKDNNRGEGSINGITPWPWPNVTEIFMDKKPFDEGRSVYEMHREDIEHIASTITTKTFDVAI